MSLCVTPYVYSCDDIESQVDTVKLGNVSNSFKHKYRREKEEGYFIIKSNNQIAKDTLCVRSNKVKFFTDDKFILKREYFTKLYSSSFSIGIDSYEFVPPFACVENSKCKIIYEYGGDDYFGISGPCYISDSTLTITKFRVGQTKEEFWKMLDRKDIPNKEAYDIVYLINDTGRKTYLLNEVDLYIEFVDSKISCIIIL